MEEQKEFKKKQLNKNDYKKDETVVGGIKKALGVLALVFTVAIPAVIKGLANSKSEDE